MFYGLSWAVTYVTSSGSVGLDLVTWSKCPNPNPGHSGEGTLCVCVCVCVCGVVFLCGVCFVCGYMWCVCVVCVV